MREPKLRYLFHAVSETGYYDDREGTNFDTDEDAVAYGAVIAQELAIDSSLQGFSILVVNDLGKIVGRVPIEAIH
jgi:hypothetical protein